MILKKVLQTNYLLKQAIISSAPNLSTKEIDNSHLKLLGDLLIKYRVPPPILGDLNNMIFHLDAIFNPISYIAPDSKYKTLQKIIQNTIDDSLRLLNEENIEDQELRRILCIIRDDGITRIQHMEQICLIESGLQMGFRVWFSAIGVQSI